MPTLVSKPLLFWVIYLGLAALSLYPTMYGMPYASYLAIVGGILSFGVQVYWTFSALRISSGADHGSNAYTKRATQAAIGGAFLTLVVIIYKVFIVQGSLGDGSVNVAERLMIAVAMLLWLSFFWFAARSLCSAEEQKKLPAIQVVGTFLLYVYLAIGAFFLSPRLKKLVRQ